MNNEVLENRKKDDQELAIAIETIHLKNDFNVEDSQHKVFDLKTILSFKNDSVETENDLNQRKKNIYSKIKHLNGSCCELNHVPSSVFSLKYLTILNLNNNRLADLPNEIGSLCNLLVLKLSGNKLKTLPKSLKNVHQLNYLDLSGNNFSEVPDVLYYSLRTLSVLDLSCNAISKFSDPPGCLSKLVAINLSDNLFKGLPLWIFNNLCQLQFLDISQNQLHLDFKLSNYSNIGIYESLQLLNIENCNLNCKSLENLSTFKKLEVLHLGNGRVKNGKGTNYMGNLTPKMFINFQGITNLYMQNVQIATFPSDLMVLKNIQEIDLSNNLLSWLPECFCEFLSLKKLYLTTNQLLFLPVNMGKLINLKEIHLANNSLSQVPDSFYALPNIEYIDLYNNQIERLEPKIFRQKNLKGIDLGLNCFLLGFCENIADGDEINDLYTCLRDSFRKHFSYVGSRCDLQMTKLKRGVHETGSDSHSQSNKYSSSSFESDLLSDSEEASPNQVQQNYTEEDNWESHQSEEDELFDPNDMHLFQRPCNKWKSDFQNNYCPANYHVSSLMRTYIRNCKLASKSDVVEEGQFDSD